jgi:O-antigen/teichoic acid export membrane protein
MRTVHRVFRNALVLVGADFARIVFGLVVTVAVARHLGGPALGDLSYVLTLVGILIVIADFGFSQYYVRAAQSDASGATLGAVLVLRLLGGTAAAGAMLIYAMTVDPQLRTMLALGAALLWSSVISSWVTTFLRARERMAAEGVIRVVGSACTAAGTLAVLAAGGNVGGVLAVMLGVSVLTVLVILPVGLPAMPRPLTISHPLAVYRRLLVQAWPFAALGVLGTIYFRIDSVMLFALRGQAALGQYSAAYRIMEAALLLPWALSATALPSVARHLGARTDDVVRIGRQALHFLFAISIPTAAVGAVLAPALIGLLYGREFSEAAGIFRILSFTLIAVFASAVTSTLIAAGRRPMVNAVIALVMVLENVGLNFLLIPPWSGMGAGIATLLTEASGLVMGTLYLRRELPPLGYAGFAVKPAAAALVAAGVAALVPSLYILPAAAAVYVGMMWVTRGITSEDLSFARGLLSRASPLLQPGRQ